MTRKGILGSYIGKIKSIAEIDFQPMWCCYDQFMDLVANHGSQIDEPLFDFGLISHPFRITDTLEF